MNHRDTDILVPRFNSNIILIGIMQFHFILSMNHCETNILVPLYKSDIIRNYTQFYAIILFLFNESSWTEHFSSPLQIGHYSRKDHAVIIPIHFLGGSDLESDKVL